MRWLDGFFALRPLVLVPAWSFFLIGRGAAGAATPFPALRLAAFTAVMVGVHLVNQVVDFESDRINDKGFFLQRGIFGRRAYVVAAAVAIAVGVGVAGAAHDAPGLVALAALLGLAYSVPPVRLAARPGLDVAANAAGYGAIAPLLGGAGAHATGAFGALVAGTVLAVATVFLHTTLLDREGDRRTAKRTTGVALGATPTRVAAAILALAAAACSVPGAWNPLRAASAALAACALAAACAPRRVGSRAVCVGATAAYAVAAGFAAWPFLPFVAGLALSTRLYYARRFALRYPAL